MGLEPNYDIHTKCILLSESDIAFWLVFGKFNVLFILSKGKYLRKFSFSPS